MKAARGSPKSQDVERYHGDVPKSLVKVRCLSEYWYKYMEQGTKVCMFFYLYKITNVVNGKIYIGVHKTLDLDDGYMGSGRLIKRAIAKYGTEHFVKTILETFSSSEEMFRREAQIVNKSFVDRSDVYNIVEGGKGGFEYIHANRLNKTPEALVAHSSSYRTRIAADPALRSKLAAQLGANRHKSVAARKERYPEGTWKGKRHTDDTKQRISESKLGKGEGVENSQHGTMWITDGAEQRKIPHSSQLPEGFVRGRVIQTNTLCNVCKCDTGSVRAKYCKLHLTERRTRMDLDPVEVLTDYENGMPLQHLLTKYGWKSEQNIVGYLNKRFPTRRRFKPGERTKSN